VHLSTWMPFERAATELAYFTRVEVSDTSVRRHTEAAGAAYMAVQTAELECERPVGPACCRSASTGSRRCSPATANGRPAMAKRNEQDYDHPEEEL
jgi:hypothetical protein